MRFLDTNVLLYAVSSAPAEKPKRDIAVEIIKQLDWQCSAQVLQEFYVNAVNPKKSGISAEAAAALVKAFAPRALVASDASLVQEAIQLSQTHQLSYWDAAAVAAARRCGATELLTEDLNAGQKFGSLLVVNPFA